MARGAGRPAEAPASRFAGSMLLDSRDMPDLQPQKPLGRGGMAG